MRDEHAPENGLKYELTLARAEEAEALRRACNLRARAASYEDVQHAMREADACHSRVTFLYRELHHREKV